MAANQADRSAKSANKRREKGEEELRMHARLGTRTALAELMDWHGIKEQGEAMTLMIHHLHALGPAGSRQFLEPPRHEITVSPKVARLLDYHRNKALRLCSDQSIEDSQ